MALMPVTPSLSRLKTYRLDSIQPAPSDQKRSAADLLAGLSERSASQLTVPSYATVIRWGVW